MPALGHEAGTGAAIRGRLTPEVGAVVQRALEAASDRLFRDARRPPTGATLTEEVTPGQRRADALGLLEAALSADLDRGTAGDRYQVVLHVDASADRVPDRDDVDTAADERIDVVPAPADHLALPPDDLEPSPTWDGTRFNVAWAIDVLWRDPR